jgi:hyperosmotically inducible periplasmic protein
MKGTFLSAVCGLMLFGALLANGSARLVQEHDTAPDNTRANQADRDRSQQTADQAKNNPSDRDLEKHIRRDVVKDKSLSTYGHNVKVIADHGTVTLRGPVHSEDEKRAIEEHARKYAGDGHVNDELEVKEDHK